MPIKVIIVDDESIILEGMKTNINWKGLGLELAQSFTDGLSAYNYLLENEVDVIISDIKMPELDGIELSKRAKQLNKNVKILFFTGFDEFYYAQKAIEIGVARYLLKPFTKKEVEETLRMVIADVESQRNEKDYINRLKERVQNQVPIIKEMYYNRLLEQDGDIIVEKLKNLNIPMDARSCAVCLIQIDSYPENGKIDLELAYAYIKNVTEGLWPDAVIFNPLIGNTACIFNDMENEEIFYNCENLKNILFNIHNFQVSIGIGMKYDGFKYCYLSYREALDALEYKFLLGQNIVIAYDDIKSRTGINSREISKNRELWDISGVVKAVKSRDMPEIFNRLEPLFAGFEQENVKLTALKTLTRDYIIKIVLDVLPNSLVLNEIFNDSFDVYQYINNCKTLAEMKEKLVKLLMDIGEYLHKNRKKNLHFAVRAALEYLETNYCKEELSMKDVSAYLKMNPSYFSRIFSEETKSTFTEYLNTLRMQKASQLLTGTNLRISEICYQVGMQDPFYFSTLFKKHKGVSPSEYREEKQVPG